MQRAQMVRQGADQLLMAENAIETALCEVAALGQMLGRMRMDSRLSATVGQDAIDGIAVLYKRLSKARRVAVDLHKSLDDVKTQIGCRTVMVGGDDGKPQPTGRYIHVVEEPQEAA